MLVCNGHAFAPFEQYQELQTAGVRAFQPGFQGDKGDGGVCVAAHWLK